MKSADQILKQDFSEDFVDKMRNAILMSYFKYGEACFTYPDLSQAYKSLETRLNLYKETHNLEYLVDVANFAMLEFMFPSFEDAKYEPSDSDKSPGLTDGISYKELVESLK